MAQPTPYVPTTDFSDYQASNPSDPLNGTSIDTELGNIKITTDQIRTNLALIQRDDGELANLSVGNDQLKAEVTVGVNAATVWATSTAYVVNDMVWESSKLYRCGTAHTSGVFATDLAAVYWVEIFDMGVGAVDAVQSTGMFYEYDTGTTASGIAAGEMRFSSATMSAVTSIFLHDTDKNAQDVSGYLATLDDSSSTTKGTLVVRNAAAPAEFAVFTISAIADNTTYYTLTVSHDAGSGGWADAASLVWSFMPTGDAGSNQTMVSSNDSTPGYLETKLIQGDGVAVSTQNDGGNETLTVALDRTLTNLRSHMLFG